MGSSVLRPVALLGWSLAQVKLTMVGLACALILALPLIHGVYPLSVAMVFLALYGAPLLLYLPACRSVGGAIAIGLGYAICAGASAAYLAWIVVHPIEPGQATIGAGFTPLVCGGLQALALWSGMAAALAVERVACRFRQPRDPVARAEKPTRDMPPAKDLRPAPTKTVKQTPPASLEVTDFASRWITVPIGIALGGLFAAIAGTVLAVALLLPPLCYWFDFRYLLNC